MTIADLVVNLRANVAGLIAGADEGRAAINQYAQDVQASGAAAEAAAAPAAAMGDAAARGANQAAQAAASAVPPIDSVQRAIRSTNAAANGSGLPRWRSTLNTVATAAGAAAAIVSVLSGAVSAVRFLQAARNAGSLVAAFRQTGPAAAAASSAASQAGAGLMRTGGGARSAMQSVRALIPPVRVLVAGLAAAGAAYGLYRGLKSIIGVAGQARRAVAGVAREILTLRRSRGMLSGLIGNAGFALGSLAGGLSAVAAVGWGIGLVAEAETAQTAFTTLLGSADQAKQVMEDLEGFAAATPFQFPELADAGKKLLAFGSSAGSLKSELRVLGDISSGIGAPIGEIAEIYGKARVQGRLFMEDINQLTGRGIPVIGELAKQFGVAESEIRELVADGAVNFSHLQAAMVAMTAEGGQFAGGMAAQSATLAGLWSTLTDNIRRGFREVFAAGAEAIDLRGILSDIVSWLQAGVQVLSEYTAAWSQNGGVGMSAAEIVLAGVEALATGIGYAADVISLLTTGWKYMRAGASYAVAGVLQALASLSKGIENVLNLLPGVQVEFGDTMQAMADSVFNLADDQLAEARAAAGQPWPSDGVKQFFDDVRTARNEALSNVEDIPELPIDVVDSSAEEKKKKKGAGGREVGSLERGSQAAWAAISGRIRGQDDAKATARNTAKTVEILRRIDANTKAPARGPALEVGGTV